MVTSKIWWLGHRLMMSTCLAWPEFSTAITEINKGERKEYQLCISHRNWVLWWLHLPYSFLMVSTPLYFLFLSYSLLPGSCLQKISLGKAGLYFMMQQRGVALLPRVHPGSKSYPPECSVIYPQKLKRCPIQRHSWMTGHLWSHFLHPPT